LNDTLGIKFISLLSNHEWHIIVGKKSSMYIEYFTDHCINSIYTPLNTSQNNLIDHYFNESIIQAITSSRSTESIASNIYILWMFLFNSDSNILLLSDDISQSVSRLKEIKTLYLNTPKQLQNLYPLSFTDDKCMKLPCGNIIRVDNIKTKDLKGTSIVFVSYPSYPNDWKIIKDKLIERLNWYGEFKIIIATGYYTKLDVSGLPLVHQCSLSRK
jgi:hypothetical protein